MANFNPEFIKRLAMGDDEAHAQIKGLSTLEKMSIGNAVDELRRTENIVPVSSGMSIYEEKRNHAVDDDAVREAMQRRMDIERENREQQERAREKFIEEQTRQAVERARAGLPRNDKMSR